MDRPRLPVEYVPMYTPLFGYPTRSCGLSYTLSVCLSSSSIRACAVRNYHGHHSSVSLRGLGRTGNKSIAWQETGGSLLTSQGWSRPISKLHDLVDSQHQLECIGPLVCNLVMRNLCDAGLPPHRVVGWRWETLFAVHWVSLLACTHSCKLAKGIHNND